ncbi:MAG: SagB/ThcOx family dehydrogenase [Tannerellaceae bacterium]|nr:SagB/ThcOx family dehydrogenase [Tannerellaceae bacterium]
MKKRLAVFSLFSLLCIAGTLSAQESSNPNKSSMALTTFETIRLEQPDLKGDGSLMTAMSNRKSDRDFQAGNLSLKHLSEILWAAYGSNRGDGKKTVPSALALYPLNVYAILSNGIYLYDPESHVLTPVVEGDHRELTGGFPAAKTAPLNLVFIADYTRYRNTGNEMIDGYLQSPQTRLRFASPDAGHCTQNVYLYCATEGIKAVVWGGVEAGLTDLLGLGEHHEVIVAQTVGY